jgi:hypothetical protein
MRWKLGSSDRTEWVQKVSFGQVGAGNQLRSSVSSLGIWFCSFPSEAGQYLSPPSLTHTLTRGIAVIFSTVSQLSVSVSVIRYLS